MDAKERLSGMILDSMESLEEFIEVFNGGHRGWPLALVVCDRGWWLTYFGYDSDENGEDIFVVPENGEAASGADLLAALSVVEAKVLEFLGEPGSATGSPEVVLLGRCRS